MAYIFNQRLDPESQKMGSLAIKQSKYSVCLFPKVSLVNLVLHRPQHCMQANLYLKGWSLSLTAGSSGRNRSQRHCLCLDHQDL